MPPAARMTDMHVCPLVTGVVPHVGGPILPPCEPTVLIGGLPAARITDMATCVGPPDVIVKGSPTVLIGNLMAARIGDITAHGGNIVLGCFTVIIGDAGSPSPSAPAEPSPFSGSPGTGATPPVPASKGSTQVKVDEKTATIVITTKIEYSGPDASEGYAKHAKEEIEKTWSGSHKYKGKDYKVKVEIESKVNKSGKPTPGFDQIIVDKKTKRMTQTLHGAGPGHQTPDAANPKRRRIAHEYGHTLGLNDEYHDTPTGSAPNDLNKKNNIMTETWADENGKMPHPHPDQYDKVLKNYGY
jgi:uncharacterized Zn-binding protein involved in type VI secretion